MMRTYVKQITQYNNRSGVPYQEKVTKKSIQLIFETIVSSV